MLKWFIAHDWFGSHLQIKEEISYLKNFGNFNLKLNSNYSLFSKIPDYGANLEISGTF